MDFVSSLEPWQVLLGAILAAWAVVQIIGQIMKALWQFIQWLIKRQWPGREDWGAFASVEIYGDGKLVNLPEYAYSGGIRTRWTTMGPQRKGMGFKLDMARPRTIQSVVFDQASSFNDFPARYKLRLSHDGQEWTEIRGDGPTSTKFPPQKVRYVEAVVEEPRLKEDGATNWWSIHDIKVVERRLRGQWTAEIR